MKLQAETDGAESCFHLYVVSHPERDALREQLTEAGIGARPYYEIPLYSQPAMERYAPAKPFEHTERVCAEILALPMGTALDADAPGAGHRGGRRGSRRAGVAARFTDTQRQQRQVGGRVPTAGSDDCGVDPL